MKKKPDAKPSIVPLGPVLVVATAAATSLLALFQWMELLVLRAGGTTVCGISEQLNCEKIWDSGFATAIHKGLGIPVAGMGLVWGLAALGLGLVLVHRSLAGQPLGPSVAALRLTGAVGGAFSVVLLGVSLAQGALCPTCLATYALTLAFALVVFRLLPRPAAPLTGSEYRLGALWAAGGAVLAYLVLLGPGLVTPRAPASGAQLLSGLKPQPPTGPAAQSTQGLSEPERALAGFLAGLPRGEQEAVSRSLAIYREAPPKDAAAHPPRRLFGPTDAPVKIVEWVDIRCGHCRTLNDTLSELKRVAPHGSFSLEARNFPLDAECNPNVQFSDKSGLRCLAAKAMICLEQASDYWELRTRLFAEQQSLTPARVVELASSGSVPRAQLEQCVAKPETQQKLQDDVAYAMKYAPRGTPLVAINGREATPVGAFLLAMTMTGGNPGSAAFSRLPAPTFVDEHAGHGH
jgi:protein-disulfide isomerase/uncharacterized membrane protein